MSKKRTTKEFILDAKKIHGDKYDYSLVNYKTNKTKVTIICPIHGKFLTYPNSHLKSPTGCKECSNIHKSISSKKLNSYYISKAENIHGDKYDYSLIDLNETPKKKENIKCPKHDIFKQTIESHAQGAGCPKCGYENSAKKQLKTTPKFILDARKIHGNKYDYSLVKYQRDDKLIEVICPIHGKFKQTANSHLNGNGCKKCGVEKRAKKRILTNKEYNKKAHKIHGNKYDYSLVEYIKSCEKVIIICPEHGKFKQRARDHINSGAGCPECKKVTLSIGIDKFIERANILHDNKYDYTRVNYINTYTNVDIICPTHGVFSQSPHSHLKGYGCNICGRTSSKAEEEIMDFLSDIKIDVVGRDISIISPYELDLYLPDYKLGIEYCGLYWHSDIYKENNYHKMKLDLCNEKGIRLIQIFEDEWVNKKNVVLSKLKNILNHNNSKRIYARKTIIKEVSNKDFNNFLDRYHIQGHMTCSIRYGLYYNDELVSVIGFRKDKRGYDLNRFASSCSVVGGFSKLLKYFIKSHNPEKIFTFADLRYSDRHSNVYLKNGFKETEITKPNYYYVYRNNKPQKYSRVQFQKHKLKDKLDNYNPDLTEVENMKNNGYYRIFDCGNIKYEKYL